MTYICFVLTKSFLKNIEPEHKPNLFKEKHSYHCNRSFRKQKQQPNSAADVAAEMQPFKSPIPTETIPEDDTQVWYLIYFAHVM